MFSFSQKFFLLTCIYYLNMSGEEEQRTQISCKNNEYDVAFMQLSEENDQNYISKIFYCDTKNVDGKELFILNDNVTQTRNSEENNENIIPEELAELYSIISSSKNINKKNNNTVSKMTYEFVDTFSQEKKDWTILMYIAGDNDLYRFALRNIEQMKEIGSSDLVNIVVHFDFHQNGKLKETRRLYIQKGKVVQIGTWPAMDSGSEETVISAAKFALTNFPCDKFAICFWNHGSGQVPIGSKYRLINPSELFYYDAYSQRFLVDRSISFLDFCDKYNAERGVCYDNTTGNYLDDQKLTKALKNIVEMRNGKTIDVILFDACLMGGLEIMYLCEPFAHYFIASQEVVLGPGYNYATTLKRLHRKCSSDVFANHVVDTYAATYNYITPDYCEAAINLHYIKELTLALDEFVKTILYFSKFDSNSLIKKMLIMCSSKEMCTHFDEPSYVDLKHFLDNILEYAKKINIKDGDNNNFYDKISKNIFFVNNIIKRTVIKSVSGKNLSKANGISIYIPKNNIHKEYYKTVFGRNSMWAILLNYLRTT